MYKYTMTINNENYTALFEDHFVAADFIDEVSLDNEIVVIGYKEVSAKDILEDDDFEYSYKIEMVGAKLYPNKKWSKVSEIENFLKEEGIL